MKPVLGFAASMLLAVSILLPMASRPEPSHECAVSSAYFEAVEENTSTLLKSLAMLNTAGSPLRDVDVAGLYYTLMVSSRAYHEDQRSELPDCAHRYNQSLIDTFAATQDALVFRLALEADSSSNRHGARLSQALDRSNQKGGVLGELRGSVKLQPEFVETSLGRK